jgi:hypothetical protein
MGEGGQESVPRIVLVDIVRKSLEAGSRYISSPLRDRVSIYPTFPSLANHRLCQLEARAR